VNCRYIVSELVKLSQGKACVVNLTDADIIHCLRAEVQRLHGDYGLALVHLSLRGTGNTLIPARYSEGPIFRRSTAQICITVLELGLGFKVLG